ncbi:MAG: Crp/Fnr family transcriptional regulator [Actinomycetota bacterium]|nr:Crp/Fnr family transcriptional regulator [Actinomycetota bacterium]
MRSALVEALSGSDTELFEQARSLTLLSGERLCVAGERDLGVCLVRSGMLKLVGNSASGRESIICLAFPGEIIGEVAAFDGRPQPLDVVAATRSEVVAIPSQALVRALLEVPGAAVAAGALMARRSRWMCDTAVERNIRYAPARLAGRLLGLAQHCGVEIGEPIEICLPLAQSDIGKLAGMCRESACRALKSFQEAGAIDYRRSQLSILNPQVLEQFRSTDK